MRSRRMSPIWSRPPASITMMMRPWSTAATSVPASAAIRAATASCVAGRAFTTAEAMCSGGSGIRCRGQRQRVRGTRGNALAASGAAGGEDTGERRAPDAEREADRLAGADISAGLAMHALFRQARGADHRARRLRRSGSGQEETADLPHRLDRSMRADRSGPVGLAGTRSKIRESPASPRQQPIWRHGSATPSSPARRRPAAALQATAVPGIFDARRLTKVRLHHRSRLASLSRQCGT